MSDRRLRNRVLHLRPDPLIQPRRTPILLSDSKGFYLKEEVSINPETFIQFWCTSGATAEDQLNYLQQNLEAQIDIYENITLFVWVGTCNLTKKTTDGYIEITSKDNSAAYTLIETLKQVYHFVRQFGSSVKLVFIQVPIYSITHYNKYKNHQNPDTFTEQDFLLRQQIDIVNQYIDDTNRILHSYSPHLSQDLLKSKRNSIFSVRTKYSYNFNLYKDGIHPKPLLAKLWLARFCRLVHDFCYD